jgi:hypothetical protein
MGSNPSYEGYSRHNRYPEQQHSQGSQQSSGTSGSTYKPSTFPPRHGFSYPHRDRERDSPRDRYPPQRRDYYSNNNYQPRNRESYYPRNQAPRSSYNSYNGYRDRPSSGNGYNGYEDRRQRDQYGIRYGSTARSLSSTSSGARDKLEYVRRNNTGAEPLDYDHKNDTTYESYRPHPQPRPSLIPKDFKDDDDEEEDLILGKSSVVKSSYSRSNLTPDLSEEIETSKTDIIADKIPLTLEHKEELDELDSSVEVKQEIAKEAIENDREDGDKSYHLDIFPGVKAQVLLVDEDKDVDMESSDDYDPEVDHAKIQDEINRDHQQKAETSPELKSEIVKSVHEVLMAAKEASESIMGNTAEESIADSKEKSKPEDMSVIAKPLDSKLISPLIASDSCCFPLQKNEQRLWELKNHSRDEVLKRLPYLLKRPVKNFRDYPFYDRNFLVDKQGVRPKLVENLSIIKGKIFLHKISLLNEYSHRADDWSQRKEKMENQLKKLYPSKGEEEHKDDQPTETPVDPRRRSRHADVVRSEAEFLEILKSLEKEKEDDPLYRAEQLAAKIPDMILNPLTKSLKIVNVNNLVTDKLRWAQRIKTDPIDTFTRREHEVFCEAFLSAPKRFGRISAAMGGLRTAEECVLHYYKTKKSVTDYKQLLVSKKKKNKKAVRGRRGRKSATSGVNTPSISTPNESGDEKELNLDNFIPKEATEELYTDSGRRRRAAAPVFDSDKRSTPEGSEEPENKRPLEVTPSTDSHEDEKKSKKKQRGPKPKKAEGLTGAPTSADDDHHEQDHKGKSGISSYWSVRDIGIVNKLLQEVGTDWGLIASRLGTKSATMVRNYYMRNRASFVNVKQIGEPDQTAPIDEHDATAKTDPFHRNPPLGFFSAPSNVPSNVSFVQSIFTAKTEERVSPPQVNTFSHSNGPSYNLPAMKSIPTFPDQKQLPPLKPCPNSTGGSLFPASGGDTRSNPFSITSLLNPRDERRPPVFPVAGSFSPVPQKAEIYSGMDSGSSTSGDLHTTKSQHTVDAQKCFNPLDALVAAAENKEASSANDFSSINILRPVDERSAKPTLPSLSATMGLSLRSMLNSDDGVHNG